MKSWKDLTGGRGGGGGGDGNLTDDDVAVVVVDDEAGPMYFELCLQVGVVVVHEWSLE